jgi:hypothetical protein
MCVGDTEAAGVPTALCWTVQTNCGIFLALP